MNQMINTNSCVFYLVSENGPIFINHRSFGIDYKNGAVILVVTLADWVRMQKAFHSGVKLEFGEVKCGHPDVYGSMDLLITLESCEIVSANLPEVCSNGYGELLVAHVQFKGKFVYAQE
jgi:hypothetical protein